MGAFVGDDDCLRLELLCLLDVVEGRMTLLIFDADGCSVWIELLEEIADGLWTAPAITVLEETT